jgi:hypothetical protein
VENYLRKFEKWVLGTLALVFVFMAPSIIFSMLSPRTQDELLVWYYARDNQVLKPDLLNRPIGEIFSSLNFSEYKLEGRVSLDYNLIKESAKIGHTMAPVKYVIVKKQNDKKNESLVFILSKPRYMAFEEISKDELYSAHVVGLEYCNMSLERPEVLGQVKLDIRRGLVRPWYSPCPGVAYRFPYVLSPFNSKYTRPLVD